MDIRSILLIIALCQVVIGLRYGTPKACFDVLDKYPKSEIEKISYMEFNDVVHTYPAKDTLSCFLHALSTDDNSLTLQYFHVYKQCDAVKKRSYSPFGDRDLQQLVGLGLPRYLEKDLQRRMKTGKKTDLENGIRIVQEVMSNEIALSNEFKKYKHFISEILDHYDRNSARSRNHAHTRNSAQGPSYAKAGHSPQAKEKTSAEQTIITAHKDFLKILPNIVLAA